MSNTVIGWYEIEEEFNAEAIELVIRDKRTNDVIELQVESLEDHDKIIDFLQNNQQIGLSSSLLSKNVIG